MTAAVPELASTVRGHDLKGTTAATATRQTPCAPSRCMTSWRKARASSADQPEGAVVWSAAVGEPPSRVSLLPSFRPVVVRLPTGLE